MRWLVKIVALPWSLLLPLERKYIGSKRWYIDYIYTPGSIEFVCAMGIYINLIIISMIL